MALLKGGSGGRGEWGGSLGLYDAQSSQLTGLSIEKAVLEGIVYFFNLLMSYKGTYNTRISPQEVIERFEKITELEQIQPYFAYVRYFDTIVNNTGKYSNNFLSQLILFFSYGTPLEEAENKIYEEFCHEY